MTDVTPNGRASKGEQAYKWLVAVGIAAVGLLFINIQSGITETAKAVQQLQVQAADIKAKLDWAAKQNEEQNGAIGELQRRVWRLPPGPP